MESELAEAVPGTVVMTCRGGLSWDEREHLAARVDDYLADRAPLSGLVLDLGGVDYVNSAGLGALFQVLRTVRQRGGRLALVNVPPTIQRVLTTAGMNRLTYLGRDVADALEWLVASDVTPPSMPDGVSSR